MPLTPPTRDRRVFVCALILYGLFYSAFFLKSLLSGNYIAPSDSLDFGLSAFLSRQTLWTDAMYSGYPIAADPQALTWYPVFQLIRMLGLGWNTFMLTPYIVASAGACLLVRRLTGSNVAGVFGGFVYGFSGVMVAHISHFNQIHAASWLPLVVYGLQLIREAQGRTGATVGGIALAMMWMSGHPQIAVYTLYVTTAAVFGWLLIDRPDKSMALSRLRWTAVMVTLGLGLSAITIVPMLELGEFSRRATRSWELYISKPLPPWQLLTLVFPLAFGGFWTSSTTLVEYFGDSSPGEMTGYVGLLPLALAVAGPFLRSASRKDAILWVSIAGVALMLCLGAATPIGTLFFYAPGYATFRVPARHFFVVTFALAIAAGFVFADLAAVRERPRAIAGAVAGTLLVGAIAGAVFVWRDPTASKLIAHNQTYVTWAVMFPFAIAAALIACSVIGGLIPNAHRGAILPIAVIVIHLGEMTVFHYMMPGYRFDYAGVRPARIVQHPRIADLGDELRRTGTRVLAVDGSKSRFLLPNLTRAWEIPAASGTGSLGIERYLDVLGMGGPGDVYPDTLSANHQGLDLFAIGYALVPQQWPIVNDLHRQGDRWSAVADLTYREGDADTSYTLFRNGRARSRAWCVPTIERTTAGQALAVLRSGRLPDGRRFNPTRAALVEDDTLRGSVGTSPIEPHATVSASRASDRGLRYVVNANAPCLLVLSEVYYPWWRGAVDRSPVTVARVNHTMVGIPVPVGTHVIRLWIVPVTIWAGAGMTLMTFLVWTVLASPWRRRSSDRLDLAWSAR